MKLGPYDILGELGRGGMGVVLRARAPDGKLVALKCLLRQDKADARARFDRERRLLGSLGEQEGFVPLLDFGDSPRGPYIVMPFLGGGTLRQRLASGPLSIEETVALGKQLGTSLGSAHVLGIVHRDLKPENVLFTEDKRPLIADLGLAKHWNLDTPGASQSIALSVAGEIRGTAGYMAPEQVDDAANVGPAADVFALGAMLYECLTGEPAFEGENMAELIGRVAAGSFEPVRSRRSEVPRQIAHVVERAINPEPRKRYADGAALARALDGKEDAAPGGLAKLVALLAFAAVVGTGAFFALRAPVGQPRAVTKGDSPQIDTPTQGPTPTKAKLLATWGSLDWRQLGTVRAVAFAPEGKLGASASDDQTVKVWDLATGRALKTIAGHEAAVMGVTFTRDGKRLLTCSLDGTARAWDLATGKEVWVADAKCRIRSLSLSQDGKSFATCGDENRVRIWDAATGAPLKVITDDCANMGSIAFLPGGEFVVSAADDGAVHVWELAYGMRRDVLRGHLGACNVVAALPDGKLFASGGADETLRIREASGRDVQHFDGHAGPIIAIAPSPDGKRLLSAALDRTLRVWDVATGRETGRLIDGNESPVTALAFSFDGRRALSGSADGVVRLWDLKEEGKLVSQIEGHHQAITAIDIFADQHRAITASDDGWPLVWDVATGKVVKRLIPREASPILSAAILPKTGHLAAVQANRTMPLLELDFGTVFYTFNSPNTVNIRSIAAVPGTDHIVTASADGSVHMFDCEQPHIIEGAGDLHQHAGEARTVATSRDGRRALSGGSEGTVVLWDTSSDQLAPIGAVASLATAITASALSADGKHALTGAADGEVSCWDLETKERAPLRGHEKSVTAVAFAQGGRLAVSGSEDGTVRVWLLQTGKQLDRIELKPDHATALAVFSDGRSFLVGTARGLAFRYELGIDK